MSDIDEIDEQSFKAGAVGISPEFVNFLQERNNERAEKERVRIENDMKGQDDSGNGQ